MLILFDQNTPVPIRCSLAGHSVKTANEQGWSTLENGHLLQIAEQNGFDVLLTADQNIAYQQKMEGGESLSSCSEKDNGLQYRPSFLKWLPQWNQPSRELLPS